MEITEYKKDTKQKRSKTEIEEIIKKMRKDDEKMVKGKFEFLEAGGGYFEFAYRFYPGLITKVKIMHNEVCELPLGLVKHLNNTYHKVKKYMNVEQTPHGPIKMPRGFDVVSRVRFVPVEYL